MKVIALGHRARQGKDSVARNIVKFAGAMDVYAKQYAFADALKAYCRVAYGMTSKDAKLLQTVGTEIYKDHVKRDFWTHVLSHQLDEEQPDIAIISDLRYPDEYEFVKSHHGTTIRVVRYVNNQQFISQDRDPNHRSEIALADDKYWDYTIANDGDLLDLQARVKLFLTQQFVEPW